MLNKKLKCINNKNKKEYEDELAEYNMNMKMQLKSKIDDGFKKAGKKYPKKALRVYHSNCKQSNAFKKIFSYPNEYKIKIILIRIGVYFYCAIIHNEIKFV